LAAEAVVRLEGSPPRLRLVPSPPTDPDYTEAKIRQLIPAWRRLRAHFEHRGDVEQEEWSFVLDIERGVTGLANYRQRNDPASAGTERERHKRIRADRAATMVAAMLACHMLLGWTKSDMRFALRRAPGMTADRLEDAAIAFLERYLAGAGFDAADRAFEAAVA
jgi:hypothetical protein